MKNKRVENRGKWIVHGMTKTPVWHSWNCMVNRIYNPNQNDKKSYGGRGIKICDEWLGKKGFQNFYKDMGKRLQGMSIDRINNNGNYCKANCRWVTQKEQMRNRSNTKFITYQNQTLCLGEWAEKLRINYDILWRRISIYNWSIERTLTTPILTKSECGMCSANSKKVPIKENL